MHIKNTILLCDRAKPLSIEINLRILVWPKTAQKFNVYLSLLWIHLWLTHIIRSCCECCLLTTELNIACPIKARSEDNQWSHAAWVQICITFVTPVITARHCVYIYTYVVITRQYSGILSVQNSLNWELKSFSTLTEEWLAVWAVRQRTSAIVDVCMWAWRSQTTPSCKNLPHMSATGKNGLTRV